MSKVYLSEHKEVEKSTFIQRFGLFFYDRRELTVQWAVLLVVFGLLSYMTFIKRQGFPAVDVPVSVMSGAYFVEDAAKVDEEVTRPVSQAVMKLPEVESIRSEAGDNSFSLVITFVEGTSSRAATARVEELVKKESLLPPQARVEYRPIDGTKYADEFDMLVSVYRETSRVDIRELEELAGAVAADLGKYEGVGRATVLRQFETGTNPATGQQAEERTQFDRIGFRRGNETVIYPTVTIGIVGEKGQDALELSDNVTAALGELSDDQEFSNVQTRVAADFAEGIQFQISSLQRSLLEGLAAVLIVSLILISWRASLTSAISMVTVILVTVAALYVTGNTLNTVTLFALILSLGLIVDDTTIKVEAIDAAKRESRNKRRIIALAAKRVSLASAAGTFTTMLGFAPMLFVGGILGDFIRILPVTIIISLALSLLVSLVLAPILSSYIVLRGRPQETQNPVQKLARWISNGLARLLLVRKQSRTKGILVQVAAIAVGLLMVVASIPLFAKLKFDIFPAVKDTDEIRVNLRYREGTTIRAAAETADRANEIIADTLASNLRRLSYHNSGSSRQATATIDLVSYEDRIPTSQQLVDRLEDSFGGFQGADVKVSQVDVGPPAEALPFRVQVVSENQSAAARAARDIAAHLRGRSLERSNGTTARVTEAEVATPTQVIRMDGKQIAEVQAGFDATDTSALLSLAQSEVEQAFQPDRLQQYGLPRDALTFDFGTESQNQESFQTMLIAFPIMLLAMYMLMSLQFKSFLQPLLIFSAIPYSLFGVAVGLYVTDNPLSFFVLVGFFALIGIAVNNTILLTDYANQARREGADPVDAAAQALRSRFRPLLTTSVTSIVALIPLALSDPFWESISVTLIFGLLSSTFLVVVTFPYVYLLGEKLRVLGSKLWHRQLPPYIQYPLDVLVAPFRIAHLVVYVVFRRTF